MSHFARGLKIYFWLQQSQPPVMVSPLVWEVGGRSEGKDELSSQKASHDANVDLRPIAFFLGRDKKH